MKSLILYGSPTKLTNEHNAVHGADQPLYYIRVETANGLSVAEALDTANPQLGETVLNTVPYPGEFQ